MTKNQFDRPARKSPRLRGYDYARQGAYFVTLCTQHRESLFGHVENGEIHCNEFGDIVWTCWNDLPAHYAHIELDAFVVMPNHVHGIIFLFDASSVGEGLRPSPTTNTKRHGLPEIVRALKSFSARRINQLRESPGHSVWQRSYHDRIIRHEGERNTLRQYILSNPARWQEDRFFLPG